MLYFSRIIAISQPLLKSLYIFKNIHFDEKAPMTELGHGSFNAVEKVTSSLFTLFTFSFYSAATWRRCQISAHP